MDGVCIAAGLQDALTVRKSAYAVFFDRYDVFAFFQNGLLRNKRIGLTGCQIDLIGLFQFAGSSRNNFTV